MVALACVWSCFSAGSPGWDSVDIPSSKLEIKRLSHPTPSHPKLALFRENLQSARARCPDSQGSWEDFCIRARLHPDLSVGEAVRPVGSRRHPLFSPSTGRGLRSPDSGFLRPVSFPTAGGDVKYQTGVDWIRDGLKERNLRPCQIKLHTSPFFPFHFFAASFSAQINLVSLLSTNETAFKGQEWLC